MRDCSFHAFEDCNCGDQCKSAAIPLNRFVKPRPAPHDTTAFQYALVFTIAALFIWGGACFGFPEMQRMALVHQETLR